MKKIKFFAIAWIALLVAAGPGGALDMSGAVNRDTHLDSPAGAIHSPAADIQPAVVYDDLTEIFARKSYDNEKPVDLLYAGQSLQSEVVHFRDVTYGTHIWRLTHTFQGYTYAHNHINRSPWNADGSRLGLMSNRRFPPYWYNPATGVGDLHLYLVGTDGDDLVNVDSQNCPGCTADSTRFRHFVWDRFNPNDTYFAANGGLYRLDVANPGVYDKVADLPNTDRRKVIYATPSEENVVMVIDDLADNYPDPTFYFVDLQKPLGDPGQVISYPIAFQLDWPGHNQASETSFHDIYFTRRDDGSYAFNYGPIAGAGEPIFFIAPLDGNAANVSLWYDNQGSLGIPYHSHPAWGPSGALTAYFGEQYPYGSNRWGWQVAADAAGAHVKMVGAYNGTILGGGHIAWDGYDPDWLFCVSGSDEDRRLFRAHVGGPENNAEPFVNPYTGLNDDRDGYQTLPRPAQSPDGTKIFYHSSMMASTDAFVDAYVAVARYPMPPANVRLASSTEPRLAWDAPLFHREIEGYHVYRSEGTTDRFVEVTTGAIAALEFTDGAIVAGRDYYYAVTGEEWSGLESDALSNIVRVRYDGSHYTSTDHEPQGRRDFDRTAPPAVQNLDYSTIAEGVYQLTWTASPAPDLWYYNVYYSVEGAPAAVPQRLIASVPRSSTGYIDWQARKDAPGYYRVTAVDRQGNESPADPLFVSDLRVTHAVAVSGALTVTLQWTPLPDAITTTVRYSPTLITEVNWTGAALLTDTLPGAASIYTGATPYTSGAVYFALKSQDIAGAWSPVSNNAFWPRQEVFLPVIYGQALPIAGARENRLATVSDPATTYWVSSNGQAAWSSCRGASPLSGVNACALSTANANASAGDTVYLRGGTYSGQEIRPANSGTSESERITFTSYNQENVLIRDSAYGIYIYKKSYITVNGIDFYSLRRFFRIYAGHHNTISYCNFDTRSPDSGDWAGAIIADDPYDSTPDSENSTYNWVHHCTFYRWAYGAYAQHRGSLLDIGSWAEDPVDESYYNLIEDNVFAYGGHHTLGVYSRYNVIRNNYIHNETNPANWAFEGYRGSITEGPWAGYNLYEGNRFGFADAAGLALRSRNNILRFNTFYHNGSGGIQVVSSAAGLDYADHNRIYHNTFYYNGHQATDPGFQGGMYFANWSNQSPVGNVVKNNIFYASKNGSVTYEGQIDPQVVENNWDQNDLNPGFVDLSGSDPNNPSLPDLRLESNSPAIDGGAWLTTITSAGGSGTSFDVADASYFTDGWGVIAGDLVRLENGQRARITHVDYAAHVITVDAMLSWTQGMGLSLAYSGAAPDLGAYEFEAELNLRAAPGDRAIYLNWGLNVTRPFTGAWRIDYYTTTASIHTVTEPLSTTRAAVLTEYVQNYQWYTVTLHALDSSTSILSDTVRVRPTDIFVYLPLVLR